MTDTTDIDQTPEPEPSPFEQALVSGPGFLTELPDDQTIWCVKLVDLSPQDIDGEGGVSGRLTKYQDYWGVWDGRGRTATFLGVATSDDIGMGSLAFKRSNRINIHADEGALAWHPRTGYPLAAYPNAVETTADRVARQTANIYARRQQAAIDRNDPSEVLEGWTAALARIET